MKMNAFRSLSFKTSKKIMVDNHHVTPALPANMPVIDFGSGCNRKFDDDTTNNGDDQDYSDDSETGGGDNMYLSTCSGLMNKDRKEAKTSTAAFFHLDPSETEFAEEDLADAHSFIQLMNKSKNIKKNTALTTLEPVFENQHPPIQKMRNLLASNYQPSSSALQALKRKQQGKSIDSTCISSISRGLDQKQENQCSFAKNSLKF